ncbi:MAG: fumarylacetoacetate hydrolase family protein [Paludibacteraceae bacterium]|jgi:2-keto-4-pentenoate hydratase/2-oxohepta-3-ene-1,7-dioic acid hydratase in catechol pathway|nr:fumarylacetoacetate hydrolase family protein [Paludibacteraceae bacterium]
MKIIGIGMNYAEHNKELNAATPMQPVVFMKPDSALLRENKPFFLPDFSSEIHYEVEVVLKINRLGKNIAPQFASRYYDEFALGVDFTARDLQSDFRAKGLPWELAKGFDNSAVVSPFLPMKDYEKNNISFRLDVNSKTVQAGNTANMIYSFDEIIAYVSRFFTLKIGDLIFTGTPAGVGKVAINDVLEGYVENKKMFSFKIK